MLCCNLFLSSFHNLISEYSPFWWKLSFVSNMTTSFQCRFDIFCAYFILYFKNRVKNTTASIKWDFHFILILIEILVPFLKSFGLLEYWHGYYYCITSHIVFLCPLCSSGERGIKQFSHLYGCIFWYIYLNNIIHRKK